MTSKEENRTLFDKINLYGFNNLTKTLSFNIYDICHVETEAEKEAYLAYIHSQYNSERLTNILKNVTQTIGAHVLNISKQDYLPQGASVNLLITEEPIDDHQVDASCNKGNFETTLRAYGDEIMAHLDKSHITVHTYPEYHPDEYICTFRVDIDVSTCGLISPLKSLNYLISSFDSDIITVDYRVRGFTREVNANKIFMDHKITSIQDYIAPETLQKYERMDVNVYQSNLFHTKMMLRDLEIGNYLFETDVYQLSEAKKATILKHLQEEMTEIYHGANIF